jgi:hypothetical protein
MQNDDENKRDMISVMYRDRELMERQYSLAHGAHLPGRPKGPPRPRSVKIRGHHLTIRTRIKAMIEYLTSAAKFLPEDQRAQTLTRENLSPLFKALFIFVDDDEDEDIAKRKRGRILKLTEQAINEIGYNAAKLAPRSCDLIKKVGGHETYFRQLLGVRAILLEAWNLEAQEK